MMGWSDKITYLKYKSNGYLYMLFKTFICICFQICVRYDFTSIFHDRDYPQIFNIWAIWVSFPVLACSTVWCRHHIWVNASNNSPLQQCSFRCSKQASKNLCYFVYVVISAFQMSLLLLHLSNSHLDVL